LLLVVIHAVTGIDYRDFLLKPGWYYRITVCITSLALDLFTYFEQNTLSN